jgi:protein arginine N-methyltransferase 2
VIDDHQLFPFCISALQQLQAMDDGEIDQLSNLGEHLINAILTDEPRETVLQIIESNAPLWYQNEAEGMSALHAAAYRQNKELVKLLIERGAVWNAGKLSLLGPSC